MDRLDCLNGLEPLDPFDPLGHLGLLAWKSLSLYGAVTRVTTQQQHVRHTAIAATLISHFVAHGSDAKLGGVCPFKSLQTSNAAHGSDAKLRAVCPFKSPQTSKLQGPFEPAHN